MKRFRGTIEYVNSRRAIVTLTEINGSGWQAERVDLPRAKSGRKALYELGYAVANRNAKFHDGLMETFKEIRTDSE